MDEDLARFRIVSEGDIHVIEFSIPDDLESLEFDALNQTVADAIGARGQAKWVMDLTHVAYAGSALLGLLINVRTKVRRSEGKLVVCAMHETIERVLRTGSMERLFVIVQTREDAMIAFV